MTVPSAVLKFAVVASFLIFCSCQEAGKLEPEKSSTFIEIEKLAQAGNPEAQYHLGMMYNNGEGVRKDPKEAFEWFQKASDAGDPLAAFKVGSYYDGQFPGVVAVDQKKYFEYTLIAANAGYSYAQGEVGDVYFSQGNNDEAVRSWKLAAAQGYPPALYSLSVAYHEGKIVRADKVLTYSNFKLAKLIAEGRITPSAQAGLDEVAGSMTQEEIRNAERAVANWKPQPTALTEKAMNGIGEAKKLIMKASK